MENSKIRSRVRGGYKYLKYAAHEPSEDTMHGPTGFSGVHTRLNSGHSFGAMLPRNTSPQRQPFGS